MRSIYEAKTPSKLSKDFEVIGNDIATVAARKYLKQLDERVKELGLDYEQCREAARTFKKGDFEGALKKIWGKSKVKTTTNHTNDGMVESYIYDVDGYGTFTEKFVRKGMTMWSHTITAVYKDNPSPSYPLATVIGVELKSNVKDFDRLQELSTKESFLNRSTAAIYNILFVCMDGYDMTSVLSKRHLKLRNKL